MSENTHSIGSQTETIELLKPRDIEILKRENFKILHIGAIQVAIKPLTRLGLNKLSIRRLTPRFVSKHFENFTF